MKFKKGDKVIVIAGKDKGATGAIVRVFRDENRVLLDGVNVVKRHSKPMRTGGKGQIIERPLPIHASNVMMVDPESGKPTRIKIMRDKDGGRSRVAVKSGKELK